MQQQNIVLYQVKIKKHEMRIFRIHKSLVKFRNICLLSQRKP